MIKWSLLGKKLIKDCGEVLDDIRPVFFFDGRKNTIKLLVDDGTCLFESGLTLGSDGDNMFAAICLVFHAGKEALFHKRRDMPRNSRFREVEALCDDRLRYSSTFFAMKSDKDEELGEGEGLALGKEILEVLVHEEEHLVDREHEALGEVFRKRKSMSVRYRHFHACSIPRNGNS
jgi:hypothetical protein